MLYCKVCFLYLALMKTKLHILLLFIISIAHAQKPLESYIPNGWKLLATAKGDLNNDGKDDTAIVIENTSRNNFIENPEGLGAKVLNTNPRHLLILFAQDNGYILTLTNKEFIPTEHDAESPCYADPFWGGEESFFIKKQVLNICFGHWSSCGGWDAGSATYKFRYQQSDFILIGYDYFSIHRAGGDKHEESINFLTRKKITTTGGNEFHEEQNHPKAVTTTFTLPAPIKLQELHSESNTRFEF